MIMQPLDKVEVPTFCCSSQDLVGTPLDVVTSSELETPQSCSFNVTSVHHDLKAT